MIEEIMNLLSMDYVTFYVAFNEDNFKYILPTDVVAVTENILQIARIVEGQREFLFIPIGQIRYILVTTTVEVK